MKEKHSSPKSCREHPEWDRLSTFEEFFHKKIDTLETLKREIVTGKLNNKVRDQKLEQMAVIEANISCIMTVWAESNKLSEVDFRNSDDWATTSIYLISPTLIQKMSVEKMAMITKSSINLKYFYSCAVSLDPASDDEFEVVSHVQRNLVEKLKLTILRAVLASPNLSKFAGVVSGYDKFKITEEKEIRRREIYNSEIEYLLGFVGESVVKSPELLPNSFQEILGGLKMMAPSVAPTIDKFANILSSPDIMNAVSALGNGTQFGDLNKFVQNSAESILKEGPGDGPEGNIMSQLIGIPIIRSVLEEVAKDAPESSQSEELV